MTSAVALQGNVVTLESYRQRAAAFASHRVLYVTERGRWLAALTAMPRLQITAVTDLESLQRQLAFGEVDLVLLEAGLRWAEPMELIATLAATVDVPMVMIYGATDIRRRPALLKRAFAEGVHDTLRTPLKADEVQEAISVLLKFQRERLKAP